ncbi:MAG TPA: biopolymer transporter ExbD [Vicinamibacterales bacterium]|nr:biopolymer transporter ExbD [Vicinamibacterales bacterium]
MPKVHDTGGSKGLNGGGRGRRGRGARVATSLSEINVVPLVDVMLVLLIIFMVTAPMLQQGLEVNLPQARRAQPVTAQPVYVTIPPDFGRTRVVQLGDEEIRVDLLHERVRQATLMREDKSVFIRMDAGATGQDLFDVTDRLKEAGIDRVGLMSKPIERRR